MADLCFLFFAKKKETTCIGWLGFRGQRTHMRLRTVVENTDYEVFFWAENLPSIYYPKRGRFCPLYVDFFWFYLYLLAQG